MSSTWKQTAKRWKRSALAIVGGEVAPSPSLLEAMKRADEFSHPQQLESATEELLLELAERKFDRDIASVDKLTQKRDESLKHAMGLVAFVALAVKGFGLTPTWEIKTAMCCFIAAAIILTASRLAVTFPGAPQIQDIREGIALVEMPRDWIAAAYHKVCEEMKAYEVTLADHINAGILSIVVGLTWLLVAVLTL